MSSNCCSRSFSSSSLGSGLRYPVSSNLVYSTDLCSPRTCQLGSSLYSGCQETCCKPIRCQTSCVMSSPCQTSYNLPRSFICTSPCWPTYTGSLGCGSSSSCSLGYGSRSYYPLGCGSRSFRALGYGVCGLPSLSYGSRFCYPTCFASRSCQSSCYRPIFGSGFYQYTY
ncbi:keratin-associated protein 13-1-like [Erinaceus europaeus]|uniref:Keratin-associated protein n=1 Tax=Erinaceus europaeus TaxID=9365 RepID=A0A1S3A356_ERIEU|nr:keratin-associated protein 13-1-like [Erinaceus europaeus]